MRLGKLTALTGVLIIVIALVVGCSDDDKSTTPKATYGSLDDPVFVPVKEQIDNTLSNIVDDVLIGLNNLYDLPADEDIIRQELTPPADEPGPLYDPDSVMVYHIDDWHIVYASATGDIYYTQMRDSLKFLGDGTVVGPAEDMVDEIYYIGNWDYTSLNADVSHTDYSGRNYFHFTNLDQTLGTIQGNVIRNVVATVVEGNIVTTNSYAFEVNFGEYQIPKGPDEWLFSCPLAATMAMTLTHGYEWSSGTLSEESTTIWDVDVTFINGTATVIAHSTLGDWRYNCEVCWTPEI